MYSEFQICNTHFDNSNSPQEYLLLFYAPVSDFQHTLCLTTTYSSSSRGFSALLWPQGWPTGMHKPTRRLDTPSVLLGSFPQNRIIATETWRPWIFCLWGFLFKFWSKITKSSGNFPQNQIFWVCLQRPVNGNKHWWVVSLQTSVQFKTGVPKTPGQSVPGAGWAPWTHRHPPPMYLQSARPWAEENWSGFSEFDSAKVFESQNPLQKEPH